MPFVSINSDAYASYMFRKYGISVGAPSGLMVGSVWIEDSPPPPTPAAPSPPPAPPPPAPTPSPSGRSEFRDSAATKGALGQFLPIVYASDRLTGAVIWADDVITTVLPQVSSNDDLKEIQTVNFALALCEGTINGILRMWIGDRLIFDQSMSVDEDNIAQVNASGVIGSTTIDLSDPDSPFKTVPASFKQTKITLFNGGEAQLPRGKMAEIEGFEDTPAYRGVAYILFENFLINSSDLPEIQIELCANTEQTFPSISRARDAGTSIFSSWSSGWTSYDVKNDVIYVSGSATGVNGRAVLDGNTLELINEVDYFGNNPDYDGGGDGTKVPVYRSVLPLPQSGHWFLTDNGTSNTVPLYILEPRSGIITDSFGTWSTSLGQTSASVAGVATAVTMPCPSYTGVFYDTVLTISNTSKDFAFFQIDETGQFVDGAPLHLQFSLGQGGGQACGLAIEDAFYAQQPAFSDGAATLGYHFYLFANNSGATVGVYRATVGRKDSGPSFDTADFSLISTIDCSPIFGDASDYSVHEVLVDPVDKCFIVRLEVSGSTDAVIKYSPYTDEIVWIAQLPGNMAGGHRTRAPSAVLVNQRWTFFVATATLVTLNLIDGTVETVADNITDFAFPAMGDQSCFFNGYEDSVLYMSSGVAIKLFISRTVRSTIELADVVKDLMYRCGLDDHDIIVSELESLTLDGYTIFQKKSLKDIFAELSQVFYFDVVESNGRIRFRARGGATDATIPHTWLGFVNPEGWFPETRVNDFTRVRRINLTYRDQDREYQTNTQSVSLPDINELEVSQDSTIDVTVPIVLTAQKAKQLAEILLYAKLTYQSTYEMALPVRYIDLDPADVVVVETDDAGDETTTIRLRSISYAEGVVNVSCTLEDPAIYADTITLFGNIGRFTESTFPTSSIRIEPLYLDIPWLTYDENAHTSSTHNFCMTWLPRGSGGSLSKSSTVRLAAGASYRVLPPGDNFPAWGEVLNVMTDRTSFYSTDDVNTIRVKLRTLDTTLVLADVPIDDLITNETKNLAYFGGELIQFATVVDEGNNVYAFSNLLRAKFGTDTFVNLHTPGEPFVVLTDSAGQVSRAYARVQVPVQSTFPIPLNLSTNIGDPRVLDPAIQWTPRNHQPWTVAALTAEYVSGDAEISWARRERYDGEWDEDGDDSVPLHEDTEEYTFYLISDPTTFNVSEPTTYLRRVTQSATSYTYDTTMQTADGFDNTVDTLYVAVAQTGNVIGPNGRFADVILLPL